MYEIIMIIVKYILIVYLIMFGYILLDGLYSYFDEYNNEAIRRYIDKFIYGNVNKYLHDIIVRNIGDVKYKYILIKILRCPISIIVLLREYNAYIIDKIFVIFALTLLLPIESVTYISKYIRNYK